MMFFCLLPLLPKKPSSVVLTKLLLQMESSSLCCFLWSDPCSIMQLCVFFTVFSPSSRGKPLLPTRNSLLRGVFLSSGPRFVQKVFRLLVLSLYCRQAPLFCNVVPLPCLFFRCTFCVLSLVFQVFVLRTYCRQKPPFF